MCKGGEPGRNIDPRYKYSDITEKVIRASTVVFKALGTGFVEKVYENALVIELRRMGIHVEQQRNIRVYYRDEIVGDFFADVVVEGKVIVELKAISRLDPVFEIQLVNYLKASEFEVGLLVNFGKKLEVKRRIMSKPRLP